MRLLQSRRRRWFLLAAGWVALLVIGMSGFIQQNREADLGRTFLDNLYLTLQLTTLDYAGGSTALNWQLQIARFAAPVLAAGTLLQAATVVFRDEFTRWRVRFLRDHVVVCGAGSAGSRLAVALAAAGQSVVVVEADGAAPGLGMVRDHEVPALVGDATDADLLRAVRLDRAARVVALCGRDAVNVAVAAAVTQVPRQPARPALRCSVQLDDVELTELLRGGELGGTRAVRLEFFNLHERAARALLAEQPAFGDGSDPHVVVLGIGRLGRSLVVAAAQQWAGVGSGPLPMTLVDRRAAGRLQGLLLEHPALAAALAPTCLDLDLDAPDASTLGALLDGLARHRPTLVAVVFDDESLALSSGLLVQRLLRDPEIPVVVRTQAVGGMGRVVAGGEAGPATFPGLTLFPMLDRACSPALVEGGVREQLARAVHEDHTARTGRGSGLHRPWDELADEERESSRRAADGVVDGLAGLGYELVPLRHWGGSGTALDEPVVDRLAAGEHERWRAERAAAGWTYGPRRDDDARHNPLLVAWADLPEAERAENRAAIRALPGMLARAGFEVAPR